MRVNSLTRLVIFRLPLWIPFPPLLCTLDWGVRGADLHMLHHLGSPAFWLPVGFGRWRHSLDPRSGRQRLAYFSWLRHCGSGISCNPLEPHSSVCCALPRFWLLLSKLQEHSFLPLLLWDGSGWLWVIVFH